MICQRKIDEYIVTDDSEINNFYCPQLFNVLMNEIHLLPLWSGIIIFKVQLHYNECFPNIKSRLTNNFVENSFGNLKKNILLNNKKFTTNELASYIYNDIFSKYLNFYGGTKVTIEPFQETMDFESNKSNL